MPAAMTNLNSRAKILAATAIIILLVALLTAFTLGYTPVSPPGGELDLYQVSAAGSITSLAAQQLPVGRQFFPTTGPLNDDLVADSGQAVQGAVTQDGVI